MIAFHLLLAKARKLILKAFSSKQKPNFSKQAVLKKPAKKRNRKK